MPATTAAAQDARARSGSAASRTTARPNEKTPTWRRLQAQPLCMESSGLPVDHVVVLRPGPRRDRQGKGPATRRSGRDSSVRSCEAAKRPLSPAASSSASLNVCRQCHSALSKCSTGFGEPPECFRSLAPRARPHHDPEGLGLAGETADRDRSGAECKRSDPKAAPLASRKRSAAYYFFLDFFALHFWTDVALLLEPSEKLSVATSVHFFFLHRAIT